MSTRQRQVLQMHLAQANAQLEEAKHIADELQESFEFLGRTYTPKKTITTGGTFDHETSPAESWDSSDDNWQASGIGC